MFGRRNDREDLDRVLIAQFGVTPFQLVQARAFMHNLKPVDLQKTPPDPSLAETFSSDLTLRYRVVPVLRQCVDGADTLFVEIDNPNRVAAMEVLEIVSRSRIQFLLTLPDQLAAALNRPVPG